MDKIIKADNITLETQNSHPMERISPFYSNKPNEKQYQTQVQSNIEWEEGYLEGSLEEALTCKQERMKGVTHLEEQVLKRRQLEEVEDIPLTTRTQVQLPPNPTTPGNLTCKGDGDDDEDPGLDDADEGEEECWTG